MISSLQIPWLTFCPSLFQITRVTFMHSNICLCTHYMVLRSFPEWVWQQSIQYFQEKQVLQFFIFGQSNSLLQCSRDNVQHQLLTIAYIPKQKTTGDNFNVSPVLTSKIFYFRLLSLWYIYKWTHCRTRQSIINPLYIYITHITIRPKMTCRSRGLQTNGHKHNKWTSTILWCLLTGSGV